MNAQRELIEQILQAVADGKGEACVPPAVIARLRAVSRNLCAEPDCHMRCGVACVMLQRAA